METRFQTSFIPKRPLINDEKVHVKKKGSAFMFISMLIFIASIAGAIFTVLWGVVLTKAQENYKIQLAESEKRFNRDLIDDLRKANNKIDLSMKLLENHLATSEIFNIISRLAVEGIRFTNLEFATPTGKDDGIKVSMKGTGRNFSSIAFQSDVFGESDRFGLKKVMKNPIISDLALDQNGNVSFSFTALVDPAEISYSRLLTQ